MALINCFECSKKISDKAISCPNCGAPQYEKKEKEINFNKKAVKSKKLILSKAGKFISKSNIGSILGNYFRGMKKTVFYALGLSIIFAFIVKMGLNEDLSFYEGIGLISILLLLYVSLYTAYYIRSNKWFQNLVFFCLILGFSLNIHTEANDYNWKQSHSHQFGSIIPLVLIAFFPYWMIKLFYGFYIKITKGAFVWVNNRVLYIIPLIIWIAVMYMIYAAEYAANGWG